MDTSSITSSVQVAIARVRAELKTGHDSLTCLLLIRSLTNIVYPATILHT